MIAIARWISRENPPASRRFRAALDELTVRLARYPELGRVRPDIVREPYRMLPLTGFPYVVVYASDRRPPVITRILHGARDLPDVLRDL